MSRITKAIRSIDILAPDMTLKVNGKSSVKTLPGALLSLVYVGLFTYVIVLQAISYLDTSQPTTFPQTTREGEYATINVVRDKHIPVIILMDAQGNLIKYEDIFKYITPVLYTEYYTAADNTGALVNYRGGNKYSRLENVVK